MPQSNKQHAVPQNVMSVDFKLIGDLTMRQFAFHCRNTGFSFIRFFHRYFPLAPGIFNSFYGNRFRFYSGPGKGYGRMDS